MRFAVFWRISVRFCGFRSPFTPPFSGRVVLGRPVVVEFNSVTPRHKVNGSHLQSHVKRDRTFNQQ